MNTMTYKGYTARIDFDERDSIFVGRVLGVRPIISFHGETVSELRAQFNAAVDDYLEDCAAQGIPPEKPPLETSCSGCRLKSMARCSSLLNRPGKVSISGRRRF